MIHTNEERQIVNKLYTVYFLVTETRKLKPWQSRFQTLFISSVDRMCEPSSAGGNLCGAILPKESVVSKRA